MGDHGGNYKGGVVISSLDHEGGHREDGPVCQGVMLVMDPVRRGYIGGGTLDDTVICIEASGNNFIIYCDMPDLRIVYRGGAGDGFQSDP